MSLHPANFLSIPLPHYIQMLLLASWQSTLLLTVATASFLAGHTKSWAYHCHCIYAHLVVINVKLSFHMTATKVLKEMEGRTYFYCHFYFHMSNH